VDDAVRRFNRRCLEWNEEYVAFLDYDALAMLNLYVNEFPSSTSQVDSRETNYIEFEIMQKEKEACASSFDDQLLSGDTCPAPQNQLYRVEIA
jgi:hypothetical protein